MFSQSLFLQRFPLPLPIERDWLGIRNERIKNIDFLLGYCAYVRRENGSELPVCFDFPFRALLNTEYYNQFNKLLLALLLSVCSLPFSYTHTSSSLFVLLSSFPSVMSVFFLLAWILWLPSFFIPALALAPYFLLFASSAHLATLFYPFSHGAIPPVVARTHIQSSIQTSSFFLPC